MIFIFVIPIVDTGLRNLNTLKGTMGSSTTGMTILIVLSDIATRALDGGKQ